MDIEKVPSVQEQPIMSAITVPQEGEVLEADEVEVKGYAWSGGGRGIIRVDVSCDGGASWTTAELLEGSHQRLDRAWAWTFFRATLPLPQGTQPKQEITITCKATDASYNTQPERAEPVWNVRGILYNAWPRVRVYAPEGE